MPSSSARSSPIVARSAVRPAQPVRRHAGWEVSAASTAAQVRLADLSPLAKILIRGEPSDVEPVLTAFGRAERDQEGRLIVGSGPDEWLVLAPAGSSASVVTELEQRIGEFSRSLVTVVDVTSGTVVFRLSGEEAHVVLAKLCAVNLSDRSSPNGAAFKSRVARVGCLVVRDDGGGTRSYLVFCDRTSGKYLFDAILDAGVEFGIGVAGYPDHEI